MCGRMFLTPFGSRAYTQQSCPHLNTTLHDGRLITAALYHCCIRTVLEYKTRKTTQNVRSKSHPTPNCMVLPPGEFNGLILESLAVYSENYMTMVVTVL